MSDISENEAIEENLEVPLTKIKKPRSQAQVEAFERVKEKRRQNLEAKKQEKLVNSAKLLLEQESLKSMPTESKPIKRKLKQVAPDPEPESESEEEVIVVKKATKKQKKVRQIIIEESSSSDETQSEEEEQQEYIPPPTKRTQRKQVRVIRPNPNDFFC